MIVIKIDVKKIEKDLLFRGEKSIYLNCSLFDQPSEFGDDGYVRQSVTKEEREAGKSGPIIGNWRNIETKKPAPKPKPKPPAPAAEDDDIPF